MLGAIVVVAENGAIGYNGGLLCHLPADLKHYTDPADFNRVIYHQRSTDADSRMKQLLMDADELLALCESGYNDFTEYDLFARCLSEQTIVENEIRRLRTKSSGDMSSEK